MPPTPNKLNLSFARNAYNVFGSRHVATTNEHQREQKTELLEGKKTGDPTNTAESFVHPRTAVVRTWSRDYHLTAIILPRLPPFVSFLRIRSALGEPVKSL